MVDTGDPHHPALSDQALQLLDSLEEYTEDAADETNITLRKQGWDPQTVAAVLTQARLRRDARGKFGDRAERMLFTPTGLEQATRWPVALRHAERFATAGVPRVADLGCGLGADAMALAEAGLEVTAVEADAHTAWIAAHNLAPFPQAEVLHTTAEQWAAAHGLVRQTDPVPRQEQAQAPWGVWLDPARRNRRSRLWNPEEFSPPLSFITAVAANGVPLGVKLGPGIPHEVIPADCEAEWVSIDGELVEVVLWFNALCRRRTLPRHTAGSAPAADSEHSAEPEDTSRLIRRAATVLTSRTTTPREKQPGPNIQQPNTHHSAELTSTEDFGSGPEPAPAGPDGLTGVLYEPDPAVIRAGLVADLAETWGGRLLDEHIAYFSLPHTSAPAGEAPLARGYRILEVMPYSPKRLARWCAEHQITSVEIKKRGVDVVPEQLRSTILPKKRRGREPRHAVFILVRIGPERFAAVVEPV
ncbi:class I SAM-dependent methyltransferase [Nesterenkonia alba]|uniref:class I SAM-dependent methyltransferase n=1 Tax=Nesterenkonia alba TaxID=515814 RepID=UPI0003B2E4C4|nr:class I SAM-dependent methyltransferase [Nesterenkonia alba]